MARLDPVDPTVDFPLRFWPLTAGWPGRERFVAAYLWTCPERAGIGREGLFPMTAEAIGAVQAEWSLEKVENALQGLERRGWLVRADGWLFVPDILLRDQPKGTNQVKGAARRLTEHAPKHSTIWATFLDVAQNGAPPLYDELMRIAESTGLSSALKGVRTPFQGATYPLGTPFSSQAASGSEGGSMGVATPCRVEGAPERPRDTTSNPGDGVVGRLASSSAEPHGNAAGGSARTTEPANGQDGTV